MRPTEEEMLNRWLAAEHRGWDEEADDALFALCAALPPLAPSAGFADRVLLRAGLAAPEPVRGSLFASLWLRGLLALCLVLIGGSLPWWPEILRALAGVTGYLWGPGDLVRFGTGALITISQGLVASLALWHWLLGIGRTLSAPLATPAVALGMVVCLLVSLVAFHFLRNLITRDRSWPHVEPV